MMCKKRLLKTIELFESGFFCFLNILYQISYIYIYTFFGDGFWGGSMNRHVYNKLSPTAGDVGEEEEAATSGALRGDTGCDSGEGRRVA